MNSLAVRRWLAWGGYALLLWLVVAGLRNARERVFRELDSSEARQQWQQWRADVEQGRDPQSVTVKRRVPRAEEPPALILMRDYFGVCLTGSVLFTSLLYFAVCFFMAGALASADANTLESPPESTSSKSSDPPDDTTAAN